MPVIFSYLVAATIAALMQTAELPLTIGQIVSGPSSRVTLTNKAAQPVTAWSLAVVTQANGRTHREVETVDGYLTEVTHGLPGSAERLERLLPGQSRDIALEPLPPDAKLEIVAVVLDDGTAMGDAQVIRLIFERRIAERDALQAVVQAFNDVMRTEHGLAALEALRERLAAVAARAESQPARAALEAVQTYHARGGSPDAIDQSLRTYVEFVTRQYELAARHAQQKKAGA